MKFYRPETHRISISGQSKGDRIEYLKYQKTVCAHSRYNFGCLRVLRLCGQEASSLTVLRLEGRVSNKSRGMLTIIGYARVSWRKESSWILSRVD